MDEVGEGPAIAASELTRRYGEFTAVDHLDLEIAHGEIFGLLGPNGAGKTTTILMLLGLSEPTEGTVRVAGLDPTRSPLEVKRVVGYVPDNVGFYADLTGRQNLRYTARLNRIDRKVTEDRIDGLLARVGLTDAGD
ncbi:MAG: ATP-binding cassette domain-containing protein, partial [Actinomycetota bacterium]